MEAEAKTAGQPLVAREGEQEQSQPHFQEFVESLLVTILLALFGTTFIFQTFKIPSQSMERTLLVGDYLIVNKFIFEGRGAWYEKLLPYREIRRGDVVVFKFPYDDHPHYVKRVIGLPGDRIQIMDQRVFVNGRALDEPYVLHDAATDDPFGDNFPPTAQYFFSHRLRSEWADRILSHVEQGQLVVPAQRYFVMGDNRADSLDSRYWGFVDREAIMGRPVIVYWSVNGTRADYATRNFKDSALSFVRTLLHLPSCVRWSRLFRMVH